MRNYREGEKSKISNWIPNIHPCVNWIDGDSRAREIVENSLLLAAISYLRGVERWLNLVRSTVQSYTRGWASEAVKMITNRRMHSWTPCVVPNTPLFPMRIVLRPSNQNGRSRQIRIFKRTRLDFIFIYTYIFFFLDFIDKSFVSNSSHASEKNRYSKMVSRSESSFKRRVTQFRCSKSCQDTWTHCVYLKRKEL